MRQPRDVQDIVRKSRRSLRPSACRGPLRLRACSLTHCPPFTGTMKRKQQQQDGEIILPRQSKRVKASSAPSRRLESLSDELILQCIGELEVADLLTLSETSRHLNRLATDDQLWRILYLRHFIDGRRRRRRSSSSRQASISTLTGRTWQEEGTKTWKELFRVAHNWSTGNARTTQLSLRSSVLPAAPSSLAVDDSEQAGDASENVGAEVQPLQCGSAEDHRAPGRLAPTPPRVLWRGRFYLVARPATSPVPAVDIFTASPGVQVVSTLAPVASIISPAMQAVSPSRPLSITEMRFDDAPVTDNDSGVRLVVFYSSGQFNIFRIQGLDSIDTTAPPTFAEEYFSSLTGRTVTMARFHSPLLVTASSDCSVRFRLLEEGKAQGQQPALHLTASQPTVRSYMCFAPMVIKLEPVGSPARKTVRDFRLTMASATPYYPSAFTVGVQVVDIHVPDASDSKKGRPRSPRLRVLARSAIAVPPSVAPLPPRSSQSSGEGHFLPPSTSPDHQQAIVTFVEQDGPFIVASKSDNTISVYRIVDSSGPVAGAEASEPPLESASPAKLRDLPLRLRHVRTLFGHTAGVDAVNVSNGRCVSTGRDGVKVWDLAPDAGCEPVSDEDDEEVAIGSSEGAWQSNVAVRQTSSSSAGMSEAEQEQDRCSWVGLDSSRIVAVGRDSIRVHDFA